MSRLYSSGRASLSTFGSHFGSTAVANPFVAEAEFDPSKPGDQRKLAFANRFGLSAYASNANQLAVALSNPAKQLEQVNSSLNVITDKLSEVYEAYVQSLRKHYVPEEVIFAKADAYIRPQLAAELEILKMNYPFAVGNAAGGSFNPIIGLAEGRGVAPSTARDQFDNWKSMKKAFKARKKHRQAKKARKQK